MRGTYEATVRHMMTFETMLDLMEYVDEQPSQRYFATPISRFTTCRRWRAIAWTATRAAGMQDYAANEEADSFTFTGKAICGRREPWRICIGR